MGSGYRQEEGGKLDALLGIRPVVYQFNFEYFVR